MGKRRSGPRDPDSDWLKGYRELLESHAPTSAPSHHTVQARAGRAGRRKGSTPKGQAHPTSIGTLVQHALAALTTLTGGASEQPELFTSSPMSPTPGSPYSSSPQSIAGKVMVVRPDGTLMGPFTVASNDWDWWEAAAKTYPPADGVMHIPEACLNIEYAHPPFNACTFNACQDYMQARWGRKLDTTDRDWLAAHPLAKDEGVPQEYTATCLQALIEPYGLVVSRIRMRRGVVILGDELFKFVLALGCNPTALVDHATTNAEWLASVGDIMSLEEANQLFRFEFGDEPLPCSIVGEAGWTSSSGVQTGAMGGHARYLPPRGRAGDWKISLQLAPAEHVAYTTPVELPEYTPRRGPAKVMLDGLKRPDGTLAVVKQKGWWYTPDEAKDREDNPAKYTSTSPTRHYTATSSSGGASTPKPAVVSQGHAPGASHGIQHGSSGVQWFKCGVCEKERSEYQFVTGTNCCRDCWQEAWLGYQCPKCHTKFAAYYTPRPVSRNEREGETVMLCPSAACKAHLTLNDSAHAADYSELVLIARAVHVTPGTELPAAPTALPAGATADATGTAGDGGPDIDWTGPSLKDVLAQMEPAGKAEMATAYGFGSVEALESYASALLATETVEARTTWAGGEQAKLERLKTAWAILSEDERDEVALRLKYTQFPRTLLDEYLDCGPQEIEQYRRAFDLPTLEQFLLAVRQTLLVRGALHGSAATPTPDVGTTEATPATPPHNGPTSVDAETPLA